MANVENIERARRKPGVPHVLVAINEITAVMAKVGISKDRQNSEQKYKFRGVDDVLNALAPLLPEHDLIIVPHLLEREREERVTSKGSVLAFVTVEVEYQFISSQDGSEMKVGPFPGEGMDTSDKATNKAMSAAYKYMAFQTFCIPTEGDNDADAVTHEVVGLTDDQLAELQGLINDTGTDIALFCEYMRVDALKLLTPKGYAAAKSALEAKATAQAKAKVPR